MTEPHLLYEEVDRLGIITLNRPERLNALTNEMVQGVADSVAAATASPDVGAIVLRGANGTLTAGYDLSFLGEYSDARQARLAAFLKTITIHPLDDGRPIGQLLAQTGSTDVVDAHLVITAVRLGDDILTGDSDDLTTLSAALGPASTTIYTWP